MLSISRNIRLSVTLLAAAYFLGGVAPAFPQDCDGDDQPDHVIRSIKVNARWLPEITLPLKRGDILTPDKLRDSRLKVIETINSEKAKYDSMFVSLGRLQIVDVNLIRACVQVVPVPSCRADGLTDKCVDVELRTHALSTDPIFMGAVFLPIPRSNRFTFLSTVPPLLRVFDPKFGIKSDRELGPTPEFEISTDLLSLDEGSKDERAKAKPASLLLTARGHKSLSDDFYASEAKLSFVLNQPNPKVEKLAIEAGFSATHQPQLGSAYLKNSFRIGGELALNPALGILNRLVLSGAYRRSHDRMSATAVPLTTNNVENAFDGRAILEGRIWNGFSRAGIWVDSGKPQGGPSYHRVAGLFGYEKEIPVGEHTVGLEMLFGAGGATNKTPEYGLFYGGNSLSDFVYQDITYPESLSSLSTGPVLRSFGVNQAGFTLTNGQKRGANSFQHFNLTVALPMPGLSAPLIPDEVVNDNPRTTLRDLIEFAVNSGEEALSLNLQDEGLSEEEANAKAAKVFGEIRPGVHYLTHYAKSYSVKPLLMFDQARIGRVGNTTQSKYSAGGGVQFTVVVARFQAGYMHTINRLNGDSKGNFVLRLVFSNIF